VLLRSGAQVIAPGQGTVGHTQFTATGTPSASTFLRGDNSWASVTATTPGGSTTQLQYNNAGAFGGISGVTTDGTRMTASTTIGVGGATPSTSGSGITFPATQSASSNANTLDDYEEGSWTPIVNGQNQPNGIYTKVGQLVTIAGDITLSFTGGAQATLSGFPFATNASSQYGNMLPYQSVSANPIGMVIISGAACNFYDGKTNLVTFATGTRIIFTQTYMTTT